MRRMILATAALLAVAGGARAAPELVQNGSFTQNTLPAGVLANYSGAEIGSHWHYDGAVTGWSSPPAAGGAHDYNLYFFDPIKAKTVDADTYWTSAEAQHPNSNFTGASPDGGAFMVLDADPGFNGRFEQTIGGLTVGDTYELSFWWAAGELSNRKGYEWVQLTGLFGADAFATSSFVNSTPYYNNPTNADGDFSGWMQFKTKFTADSTSQVLSFLAIGAPAANLPPVAFLDGVSMVRVPEPGAWALMLIGFAGLGTALRSRRRAATA